MAFGYLDPYFYFFKECPADRGKVVERGSTEQDSKKEAAKEKDGIDSKMDYWKARCTEKRAVERKEWNWKVEV